MEVKRVPKIFISYRRDDTAGFATLLEEKLEEHFGEDNVFRDLSDIPSGSHFKLTINEQIKSCDILLAVIGKGWVATLREKLRKEQEDFVRLEIATALGLNSGVVVIPVLVQEAQLPSKEDLPEDLEGLLELNFSVIGLRWPKQDSKLLIEHLEKAFEESTRTETNTASTTVDSKTSPELPRSPEADPRNSRLGFYGGSAAALISGTAVAIYYTHVTNNREPWRPIFVAFFAFVIGVIMSGSIGYGIGRLSEWGNDSRYSKLMGSVIGGTAGGILAAIWSTIAFAVAEGDAVVETGPVAGAIVVSNLVVACGMLLPEWKTGGETALYAGMILVASSGITLVVAVLILKQNHAFVDTVLQGSSIPGMLIAGAVAGFLSGIQIGITLFFCARKPTP